MKLNFLMPFLLVLVISKYSFGQERYTREVIIKADTTYEVNNLRYESTIVETFLKDGLRLFVYDNPYRISLISQKKDGYSNGIFLSFYNKSGMPQEKGTLLNGAEDGEWYYWNERGKLMMKKFWHKGKVLKTIKYK